MVAHESIEQSLIVFLRTIKELIRDEEHKILDKRTVVLQPIEADGDDSMTKRPRWVMRRTSLANNLLALAHA